MKIKCDKTAIIWNNIGLATGIGVCVWLISLVGIDLSSEVSILYMIVATVFFIYIIRFWISNGRTLIMDEEGCTVCLGFIRKKYPWKNLRVKRIEHYYTSPGYYYTEGVVFSIHKIHKPKWMLASTYSDLVHPFSFFYVYFSIKPYIWRGGEINGGRKYEVDEEMFLEKLKSWNVELEDTRVRRRRRR